MFYLKTYSCNSATPMASIAAVVVNQLTNVIDYFNSDRPQKISATVLRPTFDVRRCSDRTASSSSTSLNTARSPSVSKARLVVQSSLNLPAEFKQKLLR